MACGCARNRAVASAGGTVQPGTYRVMVKGNQIYESDNQSAAETVAGRFNKPNQPPIATILAPGQNA